MAPRLKGINQKNIIIHPWLASMEFFLVYSPKLRSQVRILTFRKWSIIKIAYFDAVNINEFNFNLHDGFYAFNINNIFTEKLAEDLGTDTPKCFLVNFRTGCKV